jgi:hypothetical protein
MKVFVTACVIAIVIAVAAAFLFASFQEDASVAYTSPASVRI